jgi:ribosomal protein L11 methyltransferase
MTWCALDIRTNEVERERVAAWLVRRTGQAVEEREDGVLIGVTTSDAADALLSELRGRFGGGVSAESRSIPAEDWSTTWRRNLGPRRIGRLLVTPSWTLPSAADSLTVVIDPETAFGTGEHGSTRAVLGLLDRRITPGSRVLDLGSGSGILAIAAIKLGAARAVGIDIDPVAEPVATANARRNGVEATTDFLTGDAATLAPLLGPADLVLSNILRSQNQALFPVIRQVLAPDGCAVFGGIESGEAPEFQKSLQSAGFVPVDQGEDEGWWGVAVRTS